MKILILLIALIVILPSCKKPVIEGDEIVSVETESEEGEVEVVEAAPVMRAEAVEVEESDYYYVENDVIYLKDDQFIDNGTFYYDNGDIGSLRNLPLGRPLSLGDITMVASGAVMGYTDDVCTLEVETDSEIVGCHFEHDDDGEADRVYKCYTAESNVYIISSDDCSSQSRASVENSFEIFEEYYQ